MTPEPQSAVDLALSKLRHADPHADCLACAAQSELAALRQRVEDAELVLRAEVIAGRVEIHVIEEQDDGSFDLWVQDRDGEGEALKAGPVFRVPCVDGYPSLTPEARSALRAVVEKP